MPSPLSDLNPVIAGLAALAIFAAAAMWHRVVRSVDDARPDPARALRAVQLAASATWIAFLLLGLAITLAVL